MGSGALEQLIEVLQQIAQRLEGIEQELRQLRIIGAGNGFHSLPDIPPHAFTGEEQPFSTAEEEKLSSPEEALRSWLEQRKLELQHAIYLELQEEPWDWFARFLGERFMHLHLFYEQWKRALSLRREFVLHLDAAPPQQISDSVQFALKLKEASLIVDAHYLKSARTLRVIPAFSSDIINFVTGGWLERYIGRLLWNMVGRVGLQDHSFLVFRNVQILLPTRQHTELDLLALYDDQALWLESKTGDYSGSVERWKQNNTYLQLPPTHAGIVLLEPPSTTARQMLEQRTGMQVLSLRDLPDFLEKAMRVWITSVSNPDAEKVGT